MEEKNKMKFKAIENIGDYKIGDEVPSELAKVWMKMYKVSPVKEIIGSEDASDKSEESKEESEESEESKPDPMIVFLNQNAKIIIEKLEELVLDVESLNALKNAELNNKKRSSVIKCLTDKLEKSKKE